MWIVVLAEWRGKASHDRMYVWGEQGWRYFICILRYHSREPGIIVHMKVIMQVDSASWEIVCNGVWQTME